MAHQLSQAMRMGKSFPWLKSQLEPIIPYFREAFAITFFTNLLALAVPLYTLQVYDRVIAHNGISTLVALICGVLLALCFDFIIRQGRSRLLQSVATHIDAKLGLLLYQKFTALPMRILEEKPASYWQTLFSDIQTLRSILSGPSAVMVLDIPFALLFVGIIFVLAPAIAWLLLVIVPVFLVLTYLSNILQTRYTGSESKRERSRESLLSELIQGRTTVKALLIDKAVQPQFEKAHADAIRQSYQRGVLADLFISMGQNLAQLTTVIMVSAGAIAIINRDLTVGALIATTMLSNRIIMPLNQLVSTWKQFASARQSATRLEELFSHPSVKEDATLKRERPKGEITVDHVTYHYRDDAPPAVNDLAFKIGPGSVVGVVGRNGCGKTTLIKLLLGLYAPTSGRVLLDDADIKQFSRAEMASWIGYVPQECFLFSGTIKDNIVKAYPNASDAAIIAAAKLSGAEAFIQNLPEGYDTQVGEAGYILSGGQRQRIAIARALLRNPPALLLDEVSNNLDSDAERALGAMLQQLKKDRTIVLVTHSPTLLHGCDRIIVMEQGRVAIAGPGKDVFARITKQGLSAPQKPEGIA